MKGGNLEEGTRERDAATDDDAEDSRPNPVATVPDVLPNPAARPLSFSHWPESNRPANNDPLPDFKDQVRTVQPPPQRSDGKQQQQEQPTQEPLAQGILIDDDTEALAGGGGALAGGGGGVVNQQTTVLRKHIVWALAAVAGAVVLGTVVAVVVISTNNNSGGGGGPTPSTGVAPPTGALVLPPTTVSTGSPSTEAPTPVPTGSPPPSSAPTSIEIPRTVQALMQYSTEESLRDANSPQGKAIAWLVNEDPYVLQQGLTFRVEKYIQRYVLAVFYFALGGDDWEICNRADSDCSDDKKSWLSAYNECDWFLLDCNQRGYVNTVDFCKSFRVVLDSCV